MDRHKIRKKNYNHKGTKKNEVSCSKLQGILAKANKKLFLFKVFVVIKPCNIKLRP